MKRRLRAFWALVGLALMVGCGEELVESDGQSADPVVLDAAVAYVQRPLRFDEEGAVIQTDIRRQLQFAPGDALWLKQRASASAPATNLLTRFFPADQAFEVGGLAVSYDGKRLLFALRGPFDEAANANDQPKWNLWEYDTEFDELRRLIEADVIADQAHDLDPEYLPDGRILFASSRQRSFGARLLDEGRPQYPGRVESRTEDALVLHRMDSDGTNIEQISFNQSHDIDPIVRSNGRLAFVRWDHMANRNLLSLYHTRPDGTDTEVLYGIYSHSSGTDGSRVQFVSPAELPDGRLLAVLRPITGGFEGGDLVAIRADTHADISVLSALDPTETSPGQVSLTPANISTDRSAPSAGGRYRSAYPLWDETDRLLVSWSPCRVLVAGAAVACTAERLADPDVVEAPPLYGLWIYDPNATTQTPVVVAEEGSAIVEAVVMQARPVPAALPDEVIGVGLDTDWANAGVGVLSIRSVYDIDGVDQATPNIEALRDPAQTLAADRPARFLRIIRSVPTPSGDVRRISGSAFGVQQRHKMREIVGYAPIEPDGSVRVQVPANVPLSLSVVDIDGRRIGRRHRSWVAVKPGEEVACAGCHQANSEIPHGRLSGAPASVNPGAPADGQPFPNTEPALWANFGESMAETRTRHSCVTDGCSALEPRMDLVFEDHWTDATVRAKDAPLAYLYSDLSTPSPSNCDFTGASSGAPPSHDDLSWNHLCRIAIHYEAHIHPLWSLQRSVSGVDVTCTGCHAPTDAAGAAQVPAAQLDLTDGTSDLDGDHFKAYRELLSEDIAQSVVGGVLQNPNLAEDQVTVPPSVDQGGAMTSPFFVPFAPGASHAGYLTEVELRLLAEWIDLGAQYYNDPFAAPEN